INTNPSSKYKDITSNSDLIHSGPPAVYQLKPKKEKFGTLTRMTVGEKNLNKTNKTILLVGETGAGKSTLINALFNYSIGVRWEDEVWFQIVKEEKKQQAESQTLDVIVYEIFGFEDKTLPYSLTIIDTPGYGNTKTIEHDGIISQRSLEMFQSEDGVHEVHAVGLVMKATDNRLSDRLMYVLNSAMSLFGKDLEKNIVALITHSDGKRPRNALEALETGKTKCAKNEENQVVHFLFNNCQYENQTEVGDLKVVNEISERGMLKFTAFLKESKPQRLEKTVHVLNERIRLTACIQNLQEKIKLTELKETEIRQIQEKLMRKVQKTNEEMKEKYEKNKSESEKKLSLLENVENEMKQLTAEKSQLLDESYQHVVRLEQIALKADSASTVVHLDFLIEKMKERGDTEKVQKLEEMRSRVDDGTKAALRYKHDNETVSLL
uniref:Septin-type G domain-containing protein n=1 Tax=Oreochromis aureus TaxID=47969 RepID=A0AAZ1XCV3_OREAU